MLFEQKSDRCERRGRSSRGIGFWAMEIIYSFCRKLLFFFREIIVLFYLMIMLWFFSRLLVLFDYIVRNFRILFIKSNLVLRAQIGWWLLEQKLDRRERDDLERTKSSRDRILSPIRLLVQHITFFNKTAVINFLIQMHTLRFLLGRVGRKFLNFNDTADYALGCFAVA